MPRNSNGTYTLPAGNPVVSGEVISTSWANPTMEDIGAELTNSLDRNGRGGMLAPFKNVDGTQSNPGMTWGNEPTTGFYRAGAQDMRAVIGGNLRMRWNNDGAQLWNGTIWSPVVSDATLEANLTAKGYAVKAANETISGAWTFSNGGTQTIAGYLKIGNGTASPGGRLLINSLSTEAAMIQLFKDSVASWLIGPTAASGDFSFLESSVERFRISNSGASVPGSFSAGSLGVAGNGTFGGTLGVTGHTTLASGQATSFSIITPNAAQLVFTPGSGNQAQLIYPSGSTFVIRDELSERLSIAAGAVSIPGSLNVTGALSQNAVAVALSTTTITGANTVTGGGSLAANRTLQLVNDVASPGSSWYYGTDAAGAKGWFPLSGVVGVPEAPIDGQSYARQNASWVSLGSAGSQYVLKTGDTMTGALTVQMAEAMLVWSSTNAAPDSNRFSIHNGSGQVAFRCSNDVWDAHDDFINVVRTQDSYTIHSLALKGLDSIVATTPKFRVGPSGNGYNPVTGATRWIGVVAEAGNTGEVGVYANDGTNNPFTALFAHPTAVGIDWSFNTGIANFQFRRAGVPIFNYDGSGVNIINGLDLKHYGADNTTFMVQKVDSGGAAYWNTSGVTAYQWYLGGTFIGKWSEGSLQVARANGGDFSRVQITTNTSNISSTDGSSLDLMEGNTVVGYVRCYRDGTGRMDLYNASTGPLNIGAAGQTFIELAGGAINIFNGRPIRYYDPTNAQYFAISKQTGYNEINSINGDPINFYVGGSEQCRVSSGGMIFYNGKVISLLNASNSTNAEIKAGEVNGEIIQSSRGAMHHWENTGLTSGKVSVGTADPATTGTPGVMFLVYE